MRISDWSSDVCSSDLVIGLGARAILGGAHLVGIEPAGIVGSERPVADARCRACVRPLRAGGVQLGISGLLSARAVLGPAGGTVRRFSARQGRSEEHTSELQSLMRISYAVFCLKKKTNKNSQHSAKTNTRTNT